MSKIRSIVRKQITTERLYNLAVRGDESFLGNGIILHNCKSILVPNLKGTPEAGRKITGLKPTRASVEKSITLADQAGGL